jgi:hypothetical protein
MVLNCNAGKGHKGTRAKDGYVACGVCKAPGRCRPGHGDPAHRGLSIKGPLPGGVMMGGGYRLLEIAVDKCREVQWNIILQKILEEQLSPP